MYLWECRAEYEDGTTYDHDVLSYRCDDDKQYELEEDLVTRHPGCTWYSVNFERFRLPLRHHARCQIHRLVGPSHVGLCHRRADRLAERVKGDGRMASEDNLRMIREGIEHALRETDTVLSRMNEAGVALPLQRKAETILKKLIFLQEDMG